MVKIFITSYITDFVKKNYLYGLVIVYDYGKWLYIGYENKPTIDMPTYEANIWSYIIIQDFSASKS